ncbi:DUF2867 domain-containing protein [Algoriphagus formosus]|uniref:DUF2867 domain-containing protein n=1 Tax=Algoriphagus formosus TaxID=2007308 RepID=UPI000C289AD1|nr:DUF2867 domain-containing protein [Algoriphagus formosus]
MDSGNKIREVMRFPFQGSREAVQAKLWRIGGESGWYFLTGLWKFRGLIDGMFGGVGFRKGRPHPNRLKVGDPLDFWRVREVDEKSGRLLLEAEMKLPGKVLLEWSLDADQLRQTITFLPKNKWGKAYWYLVLPIHKLIFWGMGRAIAKG